MTYSDKVWKDSPDHTTPLSAAGLNDWEARIKAETDALSALAASNTANIKKQIGYAETHVAKDSSTSPGAGVAWAPLELKIPAAVVRDGFERIKVTAFMPTMYAYKTAAAAGDDLGVMNVWLYRDSGVAFALLQKRVYHLDTGKSNFQIEGELTASVGTHSFYLGMTPPAGTWLGYTGGSTVGSSEYGPWIMAEEV